MVNSVAERLRAVVRAGGDGVVRRSEQQSEGVTPRSELARRRHGEIDLQGAGQQEDAVGDGTRSEIEQRRAVEPRPQGRGPFVEHSDRFDRVCDREREIDVRPPIALRVSPGSHDRGCGDSLVYLREMDEEALDLVANTPSNTPA